MKNKSNRIWNTRARLGITQEILAEMLGVAKNYVYLMEAEKKPISEVIAKKLDKIDSIEMTRTERSWESGFNAKPPLSVKESGYVYQAACPRCKEKDAEISYLRDQLAKALDRIPNHN